MALTDRIAALEVEVSMLKRVFKNLEDYVVDEVQKEIQKVMSSYEPTLQKQDYSTSSVHNNSTSASSNHQTPILNVSTASNFSGGQFNNGSDSSMMDSGPIVQSSFSLAPGSSHYQSITGSSSLLVGKRNVLYSNSDSQMSNTTFVSNNLRYNAEDSSASNEDPNTILLRTIFTSHAVENCHLCMNDVATGINDNLVQSQYEANSQSDQPHNQETPGPKTASSSRSTTRANSLTPRRIIRCQACRKVFTQESALNIHKLKRCSQRSNRSNFSSNVTNSSVSHVTAGSSGSNYSNRGKTTEPLDKASTLLNPDNFVQGNLITDINNHRKMFYCPHCPEKFLNYIDKLAHLKTHTDKRKMCTICSSDFCDNSTLNRHLKTCHKV